MDRPYSSQKLRVVHVVLSLDCGGLERVVLDLIRGGTTRQQQVSVICLERPGALAEEAESLGAAVLCANKSPGYRFGLSGRLKKVLVGLRPDVVHTHQTGALFYVGGAARALGVKAIVHTEHGVHDHRRLRTRLLARYAGMRADRVCCVSEEIAKNVCRLRITTRDQVRVVR